MLLSADVGNYNAIIRHNFREIIYYLVFVAFATGVILSNPSLYWLTNAQQSEFIDTEFLTMTEAHTTFYETRNLEEVWLFLEKVFSDNFHWNSWYDESGYKLENKLLGVVRLRQLRVKQNSCDIFKSFRSFFKTCYGHYSSNNEDTSSFGFKNGSATVKQKSLDKLWFILNSATDFSWIHNSDLQGTTYTGLVTTYYGSGYYQDLHLDETENKEIIESLKSNIWLSRQSRALFLDLVIYNGNVNLFCIIKIVFEFPPTGGVVVYSNIDTVKLIQYSNYLDFFILGCKLICLCFLVYYSIILIKHLKKKRLRYFTTIWNYLDVIIIVTGYLNIILEAYIFILVNSKIRKLQNNPISYESFDEIVFWHKHLDNSSGFMLFILWIKLFKYVKLNRTLGQLNATASKCAFSMSGFLLTFAVFFIAYATLGFLLFGSHLKSFSTFGQAIATLLKTIHGEFDYKEIEETDRFLGPIFFITFIFFIFFLLLNMFVAIVNDAYTLVKTDLSNKDTDIHYTLNFLKRGARKMFHACTPIYKLLEIESNAHANKMGNIRKVLKMAKYNDKEIDLLFSRYNIDQNTDITESEVRDFVQDVQRNKYKLYEAANFIRNKKYMKPTLTQTDFLNQSAQIDNLEYKMSELFKLLDEIKFNKRVLHTNVKK